MVSVTRRNGRDIISKTAVIAANNSSKKLFMILKLWIVNLLQNSKNKYDKYQALSDIRKLVHVITVIARSGFAVKKAVFECRNQA